MNKRKEKNSTAPTLEDTVRRLETRLREFEDRSGKKIKDLENLVEYLTNKVICKLQIFTFTIYRMSAAPLNIDTYIIYNIYICIYYMELWKSNNLTAFMYFIKAVFICLTMNLGACIHHILLH